MISHSLIAISNTSPYSTPLSIRRNIDSNTRIDNISHHVEKDKKRQNLNRSMINKKQINIIPYNIKVAKEFFSRLKKVKIAGDERVLELGSGLGDQSVAFERYFPDGQYIGLEYLQDSIEKGRKKYPHLTFVQGDAQNLPYHGDFDLILSVSLLQLVPDPKTVINSSYTSLKSDGACLMQFPLGFPKHLKEAQSELIKHPKWEGYFKNFSDGWNVLPKKEYLQAFENAGFSIIRSETIIDSCVKPNREEFEEFLGSWYLYLDPLPSDKKGKFLSEVTSKYLNNLQNDQKWDGKGKIPWVVKRMEIEATKSLRTKMV